MNLPKFLTAALAATLLSAAAFAADPTGTWTWKTPARGDRPERTNTLKLEVKDGAVQGEISGYQGGMNPISDASFKDDLLAFNVKRDFNGTEFVLKYSGKVSDDTIKGTYIVPGRDGGEPRTVDWLATRSKAAAPAN